jgi:hypothetical protein
MRLMSAAILGVLALTAIAGCRKAAPAGSAGRSVSHCSGGASFGSRNLNFSVDGGAGISSSGDTATFNFDGGTLVIEKSRLVLNGKEVASVPEEAKTIYIYYADATLTVTSSGEKIYTAQIAK